MGMKVISIDRTLFYYDVPQVVIFREIDTNTGLLHYYLGVLIQENLSHEGDFYFATKISKSRIEQIGKGQIDLRSALINSEKHEKVWYKIREYEDGKYASEIFDMQDAPEELLPGKDFFIRNKTEYRYV